MEHDDGLLADIGRVIAAGSPLRLAILFGSAARGRLRGSWRSDA